MFFLTAVAKKEPKKGDVHWMNSYTIGVDFGGGAAKATLLREDGTVVTTSQREYPTYYPENGWAEHDPDGHYDALCYCIRTLFEKSGVAPDAVSALAISAGSQQAVYLDENDRPVRRAIYWSDNRGAAYAQDLWQNHRDLVYSQCFNVAAPSRTLTHMMWIRDHEPENYKRIKKILFMKDYIRYRLTGDFVTDFIDAMGSLMMDVPNRRWSEELCAFAGLSPSILPKIINPEDIIGPLTPQAIADTGLSPRTKVVTGSTDTVLEVYANGAISQGDATIKLATAGRICVITDRHLDDPMLINYLHLVPGLWYPGAGTKSCASSFRWYRDTLSAGEMMQAEKDGRDAYDLMDEMAAAIPPGSDDLYFHPYLQGENTPYYDSDLRASFIGARLFHTKAHFTRAVLEGVGYSMKDSLDRVVSTGATVKQANILGGGAKSPLWRQIIADMLGVELVMTKNSDSSLGAAMLAGVGIGMFSSYESSVKTCVKHDPTVHVVPNPETAGIYAEKFKIYREIHDAMAPVYKKISRP
ncbi:MULTISPECIES: xylulokinase [Anaerotruncus]|uniref:xylulokinase n=1 Tax=Anaerotruncus TaxID=244127 RepID=UPI001313E6BD|nr:MULTISPECIES: FGGY family carbohydrate kinase [Anaerotruncus]